MATFGKTSSVFAFPEAIDVKTFFTFYILVTFFTFLTFFLFFKRFLFLKKRWHWQSSERQAD